jgi:hypothetical protein
MDPEARRYYDEYLKLWSQKLSSSHASFKFVLVLEIYWRLDNLASNIMDHYGPEPRFGKLIELLAGAKIARENGSLEDLGRVWDRVAALWFSYLDNEEVFQSEITQSILKLSAVNDIRCYFLTKLCFM